MTTLSRTTNALNRQPVPTAVPDRRPEASGVQVCHSGIIYHFDQMRADLAKLERSSRILSIGTGPLCNIKLPPDHGERRHAIFEYRHGTMYLVDKSKDLTTFADDWHVDRPTPLRVGMVIRVGQVFMVGVDEKGNFPIQAHTISEMCRKAYVLMGGYRAAARRLGRSHNFIRKQFKPRAERYKSRGND